MHMYETTTGVRRKNPGYTGLFAVVSLLVSILLAWAVMRTNLVKAGIEMLSSSPVTTEMTLRVSLGLSSVVMPLAWECQS